MTRNRPKQTAATRQAPAGQAQEDSGWASKIGAMLESYRPEFQLRTDSPESTSEHAHELAVTLSDEILRFISYSESLIRRVDTKKHPASSALRSWARHYVNVEDYIRAFFQKNGYNSTGLVNAVLKSFNSEVLIYRNILRAFLDQEKQQKKDKMIALSVTERLAMLDSFVLENGAADVVKYVVELFPELQSIQEDKPLGGPHGLDLPTVAPVKWKDHKPGETAPDFARRVYGPWLKEGMSKRVLRSLDPTLVTELNKWVREGNEMPADIKLLTVREENDSLLAQGKEGIREHLGKFTGEEAVREARRLTMAKHRR